MAWNLSGKDLIVADELRGRVKTMRRPKDVDYIELSLEEGCDERLDLRKFIGFDHVEGSSTSREKFLLQFSAKKTHREVQQISIDREVQQNLWRKICNRLEQMSFMRTPHQFLLLSSPPAKEAVFRECKQQHGSTFAFHGSGIENWHSIIREGLIVASGTSKQVNGAAYGKGVYLSPCANVSFGYSRMGYGGHKVKSDQSQNKSRFLSSNNITCIALCEVITSPNLKKSGTIWVSPSSDHVCTRFFFVYEDGQVGDSDINTQDEKYKKEINKAVGYRTC